ncbi:MAG: hypothetical protein AB1505_29220, partial [Candidatus Latescibacterota bacterium]
MRRPSAQSSELTAAIEREERRFLMERYVALLLEDLEASGPAAVDPAASRALAVAQPQVNSSLAARIARLLRGVASAGQQPREAAARPEAGVGQDADQDTDVDELFGDEEEEGPAAGLFAAEATTDAAAEDDSAEEAAGPAAGTAAQAGADTAAIAASDEIFGTEEGADEADAEEEDAVGLFDDETEEDATSGAGPTPGRPSRPGSGFVPSQGHPQRQTPGFTPPAPHDEEAAPGFVPSQGHPQRQTPGFTPPAPHDEEAAPGFVPSQGH